MSDNFKNKNIQNENENQNDTNSSKSTLLYKVKRKLYMLNDNFMHDDFVNRNEVDLDNDDNWDPNVEIYKNYLRKEQLLNELNLNILEPNEFIEN